MRATVLTPLLLLGWSLQAIGETPAGPPGEQPSLEARSPAASESELKLVVALFRHGVRAPLKEIDDPTKKPHAGDSWPTPSQWGVKKWGDLTPLGYKLAKALGTDYAQTYKKIFAPGSTIFLWADNVERTRLTAKALSEGFDGHGATVKFDSRPDGVPDPLFHPFEALCGSPKQATLLTIATQISANSQCWIDAKFGEQFGQLYGVLGCKDCALCDPLKSITANAAVPCDSPAPGCSGPIEWPGQFSYANTASETFLLEYANQMDVGWGRVLESPPAETKKLMSLMALHEFYFDQTQRNAYVSTIEASNLLREIGQTLNDDKVPCRRIPPGSRFGALVGHDTNIAGVASLLKLSWRFSDAPLGTSGLPDDDPLPAGALLFELWNEGNSSFVRIVYAAQGLMEMRRFSGGSCPAFRLPVRCNDSVDPNGCKLPLAAFNKAVSSAIGKDFLSHCQGSEPVCGPILGAAQ